MNDIFEEIIITKSMIEEKNKEIAKKLMNDYKNCEKPPIFIGVLKGCLPFFSDLVKNIELDLIVEYVEASSWNGQTVSSGKVKITKELNVDLKNRDVVIVEDIIDSGITIEKINDYIKEMSPKSLRIVTLLDKPTGRNENVKLNIDYWGFEVPDAFLVGYGLDYKGIYRNVPMIGVLKKELI